MAAAPDMLTKWAVSLRNCGRIALVDQLQAAPTDVELYRVPDVKMNVYFRRWLHIWQHLRDHPEYRFVWCTDGTDVEMLRAPWEEMQLGKVYVGSEPKTYSDAWAKQNHPERIYQEFIEAHRNDVMLNAGLLGGTRADVMAFAHGIIRLYYRIESYRFWKKEQAIEWAAEQPCRVVVLEDDALPVPDFIERVGEWLNGFPESLVSFYLGTGRPPQYQMQIAERLIVADKTQADYITLPRLIHGVVIAYPLSILNEFFLDGTAASLLIMPLVMLMAAQWFIRVTRWWIMRMVCLLSVTLILRNEQNAAERGE